MNYSYFAASLPMLLFESDSPMKESDFIELCREQLSSSDFEALTALLTAKPSGNSFVVRWRNVSNQIRNAIVKCRVQKGGLDESLVLKWSKEQKGLSVYVESRVIAAFQEKNPIQREKQISKLFWDMAEEIGGFDPFSSNAIFAYGVKMKILAKKACFNSAEGEKRIREISEKIKRR